MLQDMRRRTIEGKLIELKRKLTIKDLVNMTLLMSTSEW